MNWRTVDMSRESRRDQFAYFQTLSNPYVGVTVQVDVTELAVWCRESGTSFFLAVLYAAVRAANGVPELRRRIRGDQWWSTSAAPPPIRWLCRTGPTATAAWRWTGPSGSSCPTRRRSRSG